MLCSARVGNSIVASCPWQVEWNLMKETAVFLCLSVCFSFKTESWAGFPFDLIWPKQIASYIKTTADLENVKMCTVSFSSNSWKNESLRKRTALSRFVECSYHSSLIKGKLEQVSNTRGILLILLHGGVSLPFEWGLVLREYFFMRVCHHKEKMWLSKREIFFVLFWN